MKKATHTKFYAVRVGRKTGIFLTWEECKAQTWGYQNGVFRAFTTREEAYIWLGDTEKVINSGGCRIFTDGSHQRAQDYLGMGAWCRWEDTEFWYSKKITRELLNSYGISEESECSNPTAEFMAVVEILKKFEGRKLHTTLAIITDYVGVKHWMSGTWEAHEPHIIAVLKECRRILTTITGTVTFEWVKGHSGNDGNNNADKMAGSHDEIDTFADLVPLV